MNKPLAAFTQSCVLAAFALLIVAQLHDCVAAATYYVRADGNDANTGTGSDSAQAWATVVAASTKPLLPGDIIYVKAGTYIGEVRPSADGTLANPIQFIADTQGTIVGWSAGAVVLRATVGSKSLKVFNDDYLEFYGFEFNGDPGDDTVDVDNSPGTLLSRCTINGGNKGVDLNSGSLTIQNCLIRNSGDDGIRVDGTLIVRNTTIVSSAGDGIEHSSGSSIIINCILSENTSNGLDVNGGGTVTHTYNLVYGNGTGNFSNISQDATEIVADPQFASATDYHITMLSPARNAGTDLSGTVDDDLEGRSRPFDGAYDIGCYEEGPTGHWKLDETSGTVAADSSGLGNDGIYTNGPSLNQPGIYGGAANFDGTNDYVNLGNLDVAGSAITLAAWIKADSFTGSANRIIAKADGADLSNNYWSLTAVDSGGNDYLGILLKTDSGGTQFLPSISSPLETGKWIHVAAVYNGSTLKLYKNGVEILSTAISGNLTSGPMVPVWIGGSPSNEKYFDGLIDDVHIYNRALTDVEVASLYDLQGHWRLDENSGTAAADSSPQGLDGTYNGGPTLAVEGAYPGDVLTAVDFDGVDDHIDLPNMEVDYSYGFTAAFWVKPSQAPGTGEYYAFIDLANGQAVDEIWLGWINNVGFQLYMTDNADGSALKTIEDNTNLEVGKWVHLVATVDAAGNATLYRNGEVSKSGFYTSIPTNVLRTQTNIAMSPWDDEFPGIMDDVRLYNRPLSATEVAELYGLTGHWKMDEGAGSTAADSTAFTNDATLNGATWTTDCAGNSGLEFDGVADTATTNAVFDPPERGAIAFWLRSDGPPTARQRPWGVGSDFEMWQDPDGFVSCDISTDGFQGGFITTDPLFMDGRWYHLIAEYDSDDDSYAIYINGELHKSGISTWAMTKQAANTLTFGTRTGIAQYFEGGIRDFRIYNRPLSDSEKSELSGLVAYWKLDESSGAVAVDSSANSNDGTYTNGVTLFQTGNIDQAADFDGSDDYVGAPDDPTLQMDNVFSLSGWIRPDSSSNIDQMILNKEGEYEIAISPSDELKWGITNTDPGWSWHSTGHIVAIGKWTHVALIYDHGTVTTYANGVLVDTYNGSGTIGDQYTSLNELRLGGRSNNPAGKYFDGRLDDIRVFKRVLCPEEVFGQYRGGRPAGVRILKWVEVR